MAQRPTQRGRTRRATLTLGDLSGPLSVAEGGTGADNVSGARTNLGLKSMATQSSTGVSITGGSISSTDVRVSPYLVLSDQQGDGIKIDVLEPTFGWHDLLSEVRVQTTAGATDVPSWTSYISSDLKQYQFSIGDRAQADYHIPHDTLCASTAHLYLHVHWSHNLTTISSTGSVTWGFKVSYAKGHNQQAFSTPVTNSVTASVSTKQFQHMISEIAISGSAGSTSLIPTTDIEPDGILMVTMSLSTASLTGGALPFAHYMDLHYQSVGGIGTKDKSPPFWQTRTALYGVGSAAAVAVGAASTT